MTAPAAPASPAPARPVRRRASGSRRRRGRAAVALGGAALVRAVARAGIVGLGAVGLGAVVLVTLGLGGIWLGTPGIAYGAPRAASAGARTGGPATAGLEQSWTDAAGTWAVVAMGHLDRVPDTFWQLLFRRAGSARWTLVTPPGVASNGGFSASGYSSGTPVDGRVKGGSVLAGFQPVRKLTYSPIASTTDDGNEWSAGTLPSGLLPVADAVAPGAGGTVAALVRAGGGTLERAAGSLTTWRPVVTRRTLGATAAARRCRVDALTAVLGPEVAGGPLELGTACAATGVVGLFHGGTSGWAATAVPAVPGTSHATSTVLRLEHGTSGTSALLEARRAGSASLVALWRDAPGARWTASAPVRLRGSVVSTTSQPSGGLFVVTGRKFRARDVLWVGGPGSGWRSLGRPPAGSQVVVAAGTAAASPTGAAGTAVGPGAVVALAVSGSDVTVWERPAGGPWRRTTQRFRVPIEYGSST